MELIADYDLEINYHPEKANVVVDALSRKTRANLASSLTSEKRLLWELDHMENEVCSRKSNVVLSAISIQPILIKRIMDAQG